MNKKQKVEIDVGFNEKLRSDEITEPFSSAFTTATSYSSPDAQVFANPFRGGVLYNMFSSKFINSLETQVLEEEFYHKSNDLYEFYQSEDLKISKKPALVALRETIYSPQFVQWMSKLTGFTLSSTIDLSAHRYPQFGHLLCHDDDIGSENDGRRIAFIIYLVDPKWSEVDGGCLQLYDSDSNGNPTEIVKSIVPKRNSFTFFQVTSESHHQVQTVFAAKDRVSISGWFHGPKPEVPNPLKLKPDLSNPLLLKWVNSAYLNEKNLSFISSKFEKESFVQLQKFLKPEMYTKLYESMKANTFSNITGTANAYRYHTLSGITKADDKTYEFIHSFRTFLESTVFHYLLSSITGLKLKTTPVTSTVRSFSPLDYTLMNDNFIEQSGIDVIFAFPVDLNGKNNECEWEDAWGGLTQYVADTQTLLSVSPIHNTLQLVDRDTETLRFVKLLNPSAVCARREFSLVYIEDEE
ncbi:Oxoglutarate and iron-dependent oxygenase degradation C-term-domain-containing protein [Globomyces pollinis-pini]|nr:Oxoglutarate and iron-dependent oxygenase degradation C-term-domain-containing protein [Globomyces pollinis-pini]